MTTEALIIIQYLAHDIYMESKDSYGSVQHQFENL